MMVDLSVNDAVVVIQAQTRGFFVRRKLLEVRKEFQEVLKELEGDAKFACWKEEGLGMPLVTSDPKVLNGANENSNVFSRGNDNKLKKQGSLKEGLVSDTDVGGEIFPKVQSGNMLNSDTEEHSPRNETLNELHTDQVEKQRSIDREGAIVERTSRSLRSRCDGDFLQKQEFLPVNEMESSHIVHRNDERTRPLEQSLGRLENAQGREFDCVSDRFPHTRTVYSTSGFPLSGTINPLLFIEREIKETTEHNKRSEASPHDFVQRRPYLRGQALLSESWMSDRSFDPVEDDKPTAFTDIPTDPVKLHELRDHIRMELLWTEQAIQSRKKYLGLRNGLSCKVPGSDSTISWD